MPVVTALRRARPGSVLVEVDGRPWRALPDVVVVRCGIAAGVALERPLVRSLRRELRRSEALALAARALATRDVPRRRLAERLRRRGIPATVGREALDTLAAAGIVDDGRVAARRAEALAARGWGDLAIVEGLAADGIDRAEAAAAVAALAPEAVRAEALAADTADRRRAWGLLVRRGFDPDVVASVVGAVDEAG